MPQNKPAVKTAGGQPLAKSIRNNPKKQKKFLKNLRNTFNLSASARAVGITPDAVYKFMRDCPEFAAEVDKARAEACDTAEGEMFRRGIQGVEKPVFYQGEVCGHVQEYSDRMLELTLKGNLPEKYGNNSNVEITGKDGGPIEIQVVKSKLLQMLEVEEGVFEEAD